MSSFLHKLAHLSLNKLPQLLTIKHVNQFYKELLNQTLEWMKKNEPFVSIAFFYFNH